MKPRVLAFLAVLASVAFGWWLLDAEHTTRELFLCMVAWVLGFWVASGLRGRPALDEADHEDWEPDEDDD